MNAHPTRDRLDRQIAWTIRENERRLCEEDPEAVRKLVPLDDLPNKTGWFRRPDGTEPSPRRIGESSSSLENIVHGSCNGWRRKPTAAETEQVMKSRSRGPREDSIAATVVTESSLCMIIEAEVENAYSLQDVGWWIRELEIPCYRLIAWLNALSEAWVAERAAVTDQAESPK